MLTQGRAAIFPLFIDCSRSLDVSAFAAQTLVQIVPCIRLAKLINMAASLEKTVDEHELHDEEEEQDVENAFLAHELAEHKAYPQKTVSPGLSRKFWVFAAINTLSTAGIVSLLVAHSYI
jgi:hypothetical protein